MGNFKNIKSVQLRLKLVLMLSVSLGTTACMNPERTHQAAFQAYGQTSGRTSFQSGAYSAPKMAHGLQRYGAAPRQQVPYVLHAQNNTIPKLRGMIAPPYSPARNRTVYNDYSHSYNSYAPDNTVQPPRKITPPAAQFKHHLDEAISVTPRSIPATPYLTPEAPRAIPEAPYIAPEAPLAIPATPYLVPEAPYDDTTMYEAKALVAPQTRPRNAPYYETQTASIFASEPAATIHQSLSHAIDKSTRLAIEDIKIQEAQEGLVQAKAQGRFKLNLESVVGAGQYETDFSVVNRNDSDFRVRRAANLDLSLPIYQGGRINAQKKIAEVGIQSAKANFDVVESTVNQEAAIAHLNVIRDRQLIEIYKRNVELLDGQKRAVEALVRAGENTLTDEALLNARSAAIQVRLKQAEANLSASESTYKKLTGRTAPALMPVEQIELPASLADIKETVLSNNALVKVKQSEAQMAHHNIKFAKSFGRPKLALQGVLRAAEGQSDTIRRNSAAEVLLNLSVPILSGGENKSRVRQAALAQSRSLLETRTLQNDLIERIETLWADVHSARLSKAPNQAQKVAAEKAYDAIVKQRNAGIATSLDVLSVEQSLLDADINLVEAENTEYTSRLQLLGLMGVL
jgi:outer membrane protein